MSKLFSGALLVIGLVGPAAATDGVVGVPAPEIGEGVVGILLVAGAVSLINRRGQ